ncbi:TonB-dependent receptor plug domain-containing protein [Pontixanthobacter aquaemixtae]|uniref:TonB-dependent receptor plug domain-containing protein n=1 Tax=Pontixanthobacter aquaemixtae TaxID=1958940 RepID=UPI001926E8DF|nr:TonB-dependent receptor [Pontixanthobacter aquaemixtae]
MSIRTQCLASVSILCASMFAVSAAHAQESEPSGDDAIVVWGTQVVADGLALGEEDISIRQADHLSDLLRPIPGVDVGGTHSVNTRINFRGLDDRDLNVYIDGALQTNYIYHHIGNLLINPDILRSAEIQLGTNSVTHGGLGGAIRFDTLDAADVLREGRNIGGRIAGGWASNELWSGSATLYGQAGGLDLLAYYNRVDRGNFEDGSGRATIGSDGVTQNALVKARYNFSDEHSIRASYDRYWDKGDYTQRPDMGVLTNAAITGDILLPTEYTRETLNFGYDGDFGDALDVSLTVYTNDLKLYRDESNPGIPRGILTDRQVTADNWGANLLAQSRLSTGGLDHSFNYGFEYFDQTFDYVSDVTGGAPSQGQESESLAFFVEDDIWLADGVVNIRPGIRYNTHSVDYLTSGQGDKWDKLTWGLAGGVEPVDGLRIFASYTTLFRGPELAEPFGGNAVVKIINPDLQPETGDNFEAGAELRQPFDGGAFGLTARFFETTIDDYIGEVPSGTVAGAVWDANLGTAKIDGFELGANLRTSNFDAFAGFSSSELDASRLTNADLTESLREIGDKLSGELVWNSDNSAIQIGTNIQHTFDQTTAAGDNKPAYTVVNLSGRWENALAIEGMSLTAGVDNLFDETYTSHASRSGNTFHPVFGPLVLNDVEPGRNFKLTAAFRF